MTESLKRTCPHCLLEIFISLRTWGGSSEELPQLLEKIVEMEKEKLAQTPQVLKGNAISN